eukprot:scaffold4233_cov180-Ochromonas_danica.AAC.28
MLLDDSDVQGSVSRVLLGNVWVYLQVAEAVQRGEIIQRHGGIESSHGQVRLWQAVTIARDSLEISGGDGGALAQRPAQALAVHTATQQDVLRDVASLAQAARLAKVLGMLPIGRAELLPANGRPAQSVSSLPVRRGDGQRLRDDGVLAAAVEVSVEDVVPQALHLPH